MLHAVRPTHRRGQWREADGRWALRLRGDGVDRRREESDARGERDLHDQQLWRLDRVTPRKGGRRRTWIFADCGLAFFKTSFLHGRSKAHGAGRKEGRDDDAGEMAASEESDAMKQFKELQVNPRTSPPRESFSFTRGSPVPSPSLDEPLRSVFPHRRRFPGIPR